MNWNKILCVHHEVFKSYVEIQKDPDKRRKQGWAILQVRLSFVKSFRQTYTNKI